MQIIRIFVLLIATQLETQSKNTMKNATATQTGRKVYMTLMGVCYSIPQAEALYGNCLSTATLAKAILDEDGNVIGSWQ